MSTHASRTTALGGSAGARRQGHGGFQGSMDASFKLAAFHISGTLLCQEGSIFSEDAIGGAEVGDFFDQFLAFAVDLYFIEQKADFA
ncbi:MAG: hypothetical protein GTO21_10230 [Armatimonadetes bacterium]|nr:hypothetical protein [Armatimonadota bacterium]NIM77032.1 hypothetical protein [Armatimonadota bacterium]NIN06967.1 hypothetical protein [Armatimonadota bacterium]NIT32274.1 hypothetical protein [Armatimonadota bacterium]